MRTHVDLFSGIGGFSLACKWAGVETIAFSEIDPYASRVLRRHWPDVRNYGDVRGFPRHSAWLLTAGVPCQPASVAGKRKGAADDRWLWPETLAVVENGSYEWLLFENPTGILSLNDGLEFERICASLESKGYEVQPLVIPACGVGALHRRNRIWIIAHPRDGRRGKLFQPERITERQQAADVRGDGETWAVADAAGGGVEGEQLPSKGKAQMVDAHRCSSDLPSTNGQQAGGAAIAWRERSHWATEPAIRRVANGIPARVDRLRGLGNAIVPQVAYQLIKRMIDADI